MNTVLNVKDTKTVDPYIISVHDIGIFGSLEQWLCEPLGANIFDTFC